MMMMINDDDNSYAKQTNTASLHFS